MRGCDYSFQRPSIAALRNAGIRFVCRYVGGSTSKHITRTEADALRASSIDIVTNFEQWPDNALGGHGQGVTDAKIAASQHAAAGGPAAAPIYFSVDFDAQSGQLGTVKAYMQGAATVLGKHRVGVYGGIRTVAAMLDGGVVDYAWQTYAWSHGSWDPRAHIRQTQNGVKIGGADCDIDQSMKPNYGAWSAPTTGGGAIPPQTGGGVITAGPWDPQPMLLQVGQWLVDAGGHLHDWAAYIAAFRG